MNQRVVARQEPTFTALIQAACLALESVRHSLRTSGFLHFPVAGGLIPAARHAGATEAAIIKAERENFIEKERMNQRGR